MGYLITNLWLCMALALLVGVATGCWMWRQPHQEERAAEGEDDAAELAAPLAADPAHPQEDTGPVEQEAEPPAPLEGAPQEDAPAEPAGPIEEPADEPAEDASAAATVGASPFLDAPDGEPDNLTLIKGVGPKLSDMLHGLGIFHFSQIAGWGAEQVAEVDSQLGSFRGRVERDQWVDQARFLSTNDIAGFERQFGKLNRPI
jgi:predicted flap endonuclease-1-like 5' DNA nuclease